MSINANHSSVKIILKFARTNVVSVLANTNTKFDAVLKDNLGQFKAVVTRNSDHTVDVLFQGAPQRRNLALDYALWEFSTIWKDLEQQGHKVLALTN